jgi:hypothetical protein
VLASGEKGKWACWLAFGVIGVRRRESVVGFRGEDEL